MNSSRTGAADFTSEQGHGVASLPEVRVVGKRAQFRKKLCADRRVLFFIYSLSSGGAERVTANLINYWAGRGWDVTLVTLAPIDLDFYELHARVRRVALNQISESVNVLDALWKNMRRVRALRRTLREIQPNVAVAFMSTASIVLSLASWNLGELRVIGSERTFPPQFPLNPSWNLLRRLSYPRLDGVVALTEKTAEWLRVHTRAKRVSVIPNMALWPLPIRSPRVVPHAGADRLILLAVGRLMKNKGFDRLLDVFASLSRKHQDWDLVIIGEGPERSALESQVWAARLNGRVSLPGRAGNVGEWYERADLYVMCSHFEGFPNTLVEAMAYGVPAVSFDCDTGPRDIIRDGIDGILVPADDMAGLEGALERLMSDAALRTRLGLGASEVRTRFSIETIAGLWEELFAQLGH